MSTRGTFETTFILVSIMLIENLWEKENFRKAISLYTELAGLAFGSVEHNTLGILALRPMLLHSCSPEPKVQSNGPLE